MPKKPIAVIEVYDICEDIDTLTGKKGDGILATFQDGTVQNSFISWKSLRMLLNLRRKQEKEAAAATPLLPNNPIPMAQPVPLAKGNAVGTK